MLRRRSSRVRNTLPNRTKPRLSLPRSDCRNQAFGYDALRIRFSHNVRRTQQEGNERSLIPRHSRNSTGHPRGGRRAASRHAGADGPCRLTGPRGAARSMIRTLCHSNASRTAAADTACTARERAVLRVAPVGNDKRNARLGPAVFDSLRGQLSDERAVVRLLQLSQKHGLKIGSYAAVASIQYPI